MTHNEAGRAMLAIALSLTLSVASMPVYAQESEPQVSDTQDYDYTGTENAQVTNKNVKNKTVSSENPDENVVLANDGTATINKATLKKAGDGSDDDSSNFYGINAIVLSVGSNAQANVWNSLLSSTSTGFNALFATNEGTIYAYNDTIQTTADNARGLDATYDGTIIAKKVKVTTQSDHSASLATDRGGGNVSVSNSTLSTTGSGSPLIYSTGYIVVDDVTGTSTNSQIASLEGDNTILIQDSELNSTMTTKTTSDPMAYGIILYQSTSGDADTSSSQTAHFQVKDSTLASNIQSGAMFYVTNTKANIYLNNTKLDFDTSKANLLTVAGNDSNNWGQSGSNGGTVTFTAKKQTLKGNISVDDMSSLDLYLLKNTSYTGSISGSADVSVDKTSKWVVTDDTTVNNLAVTKGTKIIDSKGKTVSIVANSKTVVKGDSSLTLTVTGNYSTTVTTTSINNAITSTIDTTSFEAYYKNHKS